MLLDSILLITAVHRGNQLDPESLWSSEVFAKKPFDLRWNGKREVKDLIKLRLISLILKPRELWISKQSIWFTKVENKNTVTIIRIGARATKRKSPFKTTICIRFELIEVIQLCTLTFYLPRPLFIDFFLAFLQ